MSDHLVKVSDLQIGFKNEEGELIPAVRGLSFTLGREKLGIVGESGSGKSLTGRALLGVLPPNAVVSASHLSFENTDLLTAPSAELRKLRGLKMGMILQDPKYSLNPIMKVGNQIIEAIQVSNKISKAKAKKAVFDILEAVKIRDVKRVYKQYPHEVSGGMAQRIMIAMMLVRKPDLLIADEPTSALDVTVQESVLDILDNLVDERNMGLIFISHDLNLVSRFCDRVLVMYSGQVVEELVASKLHDAKHPYTRGLINCMPTLNGSLEPLPVLKRDPSWLGAAQIGSGK